MALFQRRALDVVLTFGRILGVCHIIKAPPLKRYVFYLYCALISLILFLIYPILEFIDVLFFCNTITDYTQNLCLSLIHLANIFKVLNLVWHRNQLRDIANSVLDIEERFATHPDQKQLLTSKERVLHIQMILFAGVIFMTCLLAVITVLLVPETIGVEFPFRVYLPKFLPTAVQRIYCVLGADFVAITLMCNDCINMVLMQHIATQYSIMSIGLQKINTKSHFIEIIKHHQMVLRLSKATEDLFSSVVFLQFIASSVIFALTLFSATVRSTVGFEDLTLYIYVVCLLSELYIFCKSGQIVVDANEKMQATAYISWSPESEFGKYLIFFIAMAQRPIKLTGGGFIPLSMETFTTVLTKSYSFMTLLRQLYSDGY